MHINCVFVISQDILTNLDRAIISDVIVIDFQYYVILLKDAICRGAFKNFDHQHAILVSIKAIGCFRRRAVQSLCAKAQIRKSIERSVFAVLQYMSDDVRWHKVAQVFRPPSCICLHYYPDDLLVYDDGSTTVARVNRCVNLTGQQVGAGMRIDLLLHPGEYALGDAQSFATNGISIHRDFLQRFG